MVASLPDGSQWSLPPGSAPCAATSRAAPELACSTNRVGQSDVLSFPSLGYRRYLASTVTHSTLSRLIHSRGGQQPSCEQPSAESMWWETKAFQANSPQGTEASCKSHTRELRKWSRPVMPSDDSSPNQLLTATSQESLSQNHPVKSLWILDPPKLWNNVCFFKLLSFGLTCYAVITSALHNQESNPFRRFLF